jgi:hypothetical protein
MNGETAVPRDALLESFAAELTLAAYRVALGTRTQGTWLDLELRLWRVLAEKVKTWGQGNHGQTWTRQNRRRSKVNDADEASR